MHRTIRHGAAAVSLLLVGASTAADAQFARPIRFHVNAGAALPVGDFGSSDDANPDARFAELGYRLGAGIELRPPFLPIGLRLDGAFDRMGTENDAAHYSIWSVTANAVFSPMVSPIYFIGGIGYYGVKATADVPGGTISSDTQNEFGFNLGGGFQLPVPGFSPFIEARWNRVNLDVNGESSNVDYIPIVFGLRF